MSDFWVSIGTVLGAICVGNSEFRDGFRMVGVSDCKNV